MGSIRPTFIKRVAIELVRKYPAKFNHDFASNKQSVMQLTDISSKKMCNLVAGYVTRYLRRKVA
jgi:small subunit ribosomal protein S17e